MTKAYFYLKGFLDTIQSSSSTKQFHVDLDGFFVGGVQQLTGDFLTEKIAIGPVDRSLFEISDCDTDFSTCAIGGVADSWNPFRYLFQSVYTSQVNGIWRGEFGQSNSGNTYGFEGAGFGFDKLNVPINDIPSGGSSGAASNGAFYVVFDETQDFQMTFATRIFETDPVTSLDNLTNHVFTYDASSCSFDYFTVDVTSGGDPVNRTEWAFLSGGTAGWIDLGCGGSGGNLGDDPIVTQSICTVPTILTQPSTIVDEDLDECCYQSPVLASSTSNDEWKNDINSFLFKRNFPSETITLTLQKNGVTDLPIVNNDYGIYYDFGAFSDYPNYKGVQINWQNVLLLEGEGTYRVKVEIGYITGTVTEFTIPFELKEYSQDRANGTFRVQSVQNGYLRHFDFDFTGLNWIDGLRIRGFFGNRQPEYENENVLYANRESRQVRSELINNYVCQTMHIPDCITDQIIEYHNFANRLFFTDYNLNNHKKTYIQKEVVFESMDNIDYKDVTHLAPLQLNYRDYTQNYVKTNC